MLSPVEPVASRSAGSMRLEAVRPDAVLYHAELVAEVVVEPTVEQRVDGGGALG